MTKIAFRKTLSANDVGATGGHQGGILIPKGEGDLLAFLPPLDPSVKNPDAWIVCIDENGETRRLRFVYYNNKLHDPLGTRNEYRFTYMTSYFREMGARVGDVFEISEGDSRGHYSIKVLRKREENLPIPTIGTARIKLTGWRRVH